MKEVVLKNRSYTLSSTRGHVVRLEKDVPTMVPDEVFSEVVAIGAQLVDGSSADIVEAPGVDTGPKTPEERKERIHQAILRIVQSGQREDFTAANTPHPEAVSREAGFKCDGREIRPIWQKVQAREEA